MTLCYHNSQLLRFDWAVELVQRLGGIVNNVGNTALLKLLLGNAEKTDFSSRGFKILWEIEKNIKIDELKKYLRKIPQLKK